MERKLPSRAHNLDKVIAARTELEKHTIETDVIDSANTEKETEQVVKIGSIVRIEYLGEHPQTRLVQVVDIEEEFGGVKRSNAVDNVIKMESELAKKIFGQPVSSQEIDVPPKARVRILEIINYEIAKSPEPL